MEIKSPLTGRRGVALPFVDYCTIISSDRNHFKKLFAKIIEYGKKNRWEIIELRGGEKYLNDKIPSEIYFTHSLNLALSEQKIFSAFRSSTKRNIKKAINNNVQVKILNSLESVKEFYRLNCLTRKDHGLPPQPWHFFKKNFENIISLPKGFVSLAIFKERAIAGAVYFHFGEKAIYKYGASDRIYQHLRPNNLIMWEAIKCCKQNGCKHLSFGRTEPDHEGLLQFKRGWGTIEEAMHYYRYDLIKNEFVKKSSRIKSFNSFFRNIPLPLLKFSGRLLYRHVG
jgi:lipid II:glycine glycyltransferase (peptidoglycan interpeptide bridge formation enzyme)